MSLYTLNRAPLCAALIGGLVLFGTGANAGDVADAADPAGGADASRRLIGTWLHQFTFIDCDTGAPFRAAFPVLKPLIGTDRTPTSPPGAAPRCER